MPSKTKQSTPAKKADAAKRARQEGQLDSRQEHRSQEGQSG